MELQKINRGTLATTNLEDIRDKALDTVACEDIATVNLVYRDLVATRQNIKKTGKAMRDTATAYSRDVMAQEKAFLAIIADAEDKLKKQKDELEYYEKLDKNMHKLEPRIAELADYDYEVQDEEKEELILMNKTKYEKYLADKKEIYLLKKERELQQKEADARAKERAEREAQEKIERAKQEAEKRIADAKLKAEQEAKAKLEAEEKKREEENKKAQEKIDARIDEMLDSKNERERKIKEGLRRAGFDPSKETYKVQGNKVFIYRSFTI